MRSLVILGVLVLVILAGSFAMVSRSGRQTTDDAEVDARIVPVAALTTGMIKTVRVEENQLIEAGTVLVELENGDLLAQLAAGQTNLAAAHVKVHQAQIAGGSANASALAASVLAKEELKVAEAQLAQAQAALAAAAFALEHSQLKAPIRGLVTRRAVEVGQIVSAGEPLMAIVSRDDLWVVANFKETQIAQMHAQQRALVTVDAYRDHPFKAHIESLSGATGSRFALVQSDSGNANFVKVSQRLPVRLKFDEPIAVPLAAGMNASVVVYTKDL